MKRYKFFEGENGGGTGGTTIPVVAPANEAVTGATIDHSAKIAELNGKLSQTEQDFYRRLSEQEENIRRSIEESKTGYQERINSLEEKIASMSAPAPVPVETPPPGVPFETPEIVESPAKPEKMRKGIRARRQERHKKK